MDGSDEAAEMVEKPRSDQGDEQLHIAVASQLTKNAMSLIGQRSKRVIA